MLKKIMIVFVMIAVLAVSVPKKAEAAYSDGAAIGASLFFGYPNQGLTLVGQFKGVPLMFGVQAVADILDPYYQHFGIGLTMDWWGFKKLLGKAGESDVHFYLGPGLAANTSFGSGYWSVNLGLRMPIGFSFIIKQKWEIFLEPAPVINLIHADEDYGLSILGIHVADGRYDNEYYDKHGRRRKKNWRIEHFLNLSFQFGFRYWF